MAISKTEALRSGSVSNQQALVQLLNPQTVSPIRRIIPGGRSMLDELDQQRLEKAVFTWLRGTRHFEEVTISLAADPDKFRLQVRKLIDFPATRQHPIWVTHQEGKRYLARIMADAMKKHKLVSIKADKEGLFLSVDADDKFFPTRTANAGDVEAATETGVELAIGDIVPNEDWEPYIEFIPQRRSRYGRR